MKIIMINNIPIELERKRIKNMYLRILPPDGRIHISAPMKMSEDEIRRFILSKEEWIRKHQLQIEKRHSNDNLEYITGEQLSIWGEPYRLVLKEGSSRNSVKVVGEEVILSCKAGSDTKQREHMMKQWYRKALEQEIPFLLARWEKNIGVKSYSWNIRDMKTRWGTCNIRTKNICLNLQLAKKPPSCLEYVVVHELVHLLERSHNHRFKAYMDLFLPNWRMIKRELNGLE